MDKMGKKKASDRDGDTPSSHVGGGEDMESVASKSDDQSVSSRLDNLEKGFHDFKEQITSMLHDFITSSKSSDPTVPIAIEKNAINPILESSPHTSTSPVSPTERIEHIIDQRNQRHVPVTHPYGASGKHVPSRREARFNGRNGNFAPLPNETLPGIENDNMGALGNYHDYEKEISTPIFPHHDHTVPSRESLKDDGTTNTPRRSEDRKGPRVKMNTFDGTTDWESFIVPFERLATSYRWTDTDKINTLFESFRGNAIRFLCTMTKDQDLSFEEIRSELAERFGAKEHPLAMRAKLSSITQGKESLEEFAEEVNRLAFQAYNNAGKAVRESAASYAFLMGIKSRDIGYQILIQEPATLAEAVALVRNHELHHSAVYGRSKDTNQGRSRRVTWGDQQNESSSDEEPQVRQVGTPGRTLAASLDELRLAVSEGFKTQRDDLRKHDETFVLQGNVMGKCSDIIQSQGQALKKLESKLNLLMSSDSSPSKNERSKENSMEVWKKLGNQFGVSLPEKNEYTPNTSRDGVRNGRSRSPARSSSPGRNECYHCGEVGHFKPDCPKLRYRSPSPSRNRSPVNWKGSSPLAGTRPQTQ